MTALANQVILSGCLDGDPEIIRGDDTDDQASLCIDKHAVMVVDPDDVAVARSLRAGDAVFVQGHLISDVTVNVLHERYRRTTIMVDKTGLFIPMAEPDARLDLKRSTLLNR